MARFKIDDRVQTREPMFPQFGHVVLQDREEVVVEFDDGATHTKKEWDLLLIRPACPLHGRGYCDLCD